jgi:hypothetical protein
MAPEKQIDRPGTGGQGREVNREDARKREWAVLDEDADQAKPGHL